VRWRPQVLPVGVQPVALAQPSSRDALEGVHQPGDRDLRRVGDEQVLAGQHPTPVLGHQDHMHVEGSDDVSASTVVVLSDRPHRLGGMLVRYRYRIDPTPSQRQALARAFGCARVVYNDALAERRHASLAGEKLSDTEIQRRVITQAKRTPERAWLAEVASVALVQACQDARRAYRNWFDSRSGRRKGRRIGQPRFRTKHGTQSIRLTRNGFALPGCQPAAPAGRAAATRSGAAAARPQAPGVGQPRQGPPAGRGRASQGPRPAGRSPPQARPAADPREPSGRRGGLVRGRAWTEPAGQERPRRGLGDLGPAAGAQGHPARASGRQDRPLEPTSQICSACRHRVGPKPLGVRAWACPACGVLQDRDANAARNILVAAGLAETQNACGGSVSPGQPLAVASEAGTRRGAA
jgi:hypothetical protein